MHRKIVNHWTGGGLYPTRHDLLHYHFLIDGKGCLHLGYKSREENDNCFDGSYVPHTGGGNTKSIGVALCGMAGFTTPQNSGNQLLTKIQTEKLFYINALLLRQEGMTSVHRQNLFTHYEFGVQHPDSPSAGKIDITHLPPYKYLDINEVGDFIRHKSLWYLKKLNL